MFNRITGLLILLCFLLVKAVPLFSGEHRHLQNTLLCCILQGDNEPSEAEKESKQLEISDEDFNDQSLLELPSLTIAKHTRHIIVSDVMALSIALPYPPPDRCS